MAMAKNTLTADSILEHAIVLAQKSSWQSFSLVELALLLDCSLSDIKQFYRSKDDIAEALFNLADDAMLNLALDKKHQNLTSNEKLFNAIMAWFDSLMPYRPLVREILAYKFEPGHFHLQVHGITRVSRTVQWFLEVADRKNTGCKRITDEMAVTSAYLISFRSFLCDHSEGHVKTRQLLERLLRHVS
jgi:AcrR family transcriptional regulator